MLCNWSWPTTERVSRVIVSVVLPCVTSIHFTLMLALGLGLAIAVAVGVATGVALPVFGVLVGLGVAVAAGVLVGVGVPFPGVAFAVGVSETVGVAVAVTFVVLGSVLSRLSISLILGMSFGANLVMVTTVTVFPPNVRSSKVGSSWL